MRWNGAGNLANILSMANTPNLAHQMRCAILAGNERRAMLASLFSADHIELLQFSVEVFENLEDAAEWFLEPVPTLGGATPLQHMASPGGQEAVRQLLGRLMHGVFM